MACLVDRVLAQEQQDEAEAWACEVSSQSPYVTIFPHLLAPFLLTSSTAGPFLSLSLCTCKVSAIVLSVHGHG